MLYKRYFYFSLMGILILLTSLGFAQIDFQSYVQQHLDYIQVDNNTLSNKLYPINNNKKVYFFGSYKYFTVNKISEIEQVKKQTHREELLALLKDGKILIVSNYVDPDTSCKTISNKTKKYFDWYPEKIKTQKNNIYLVGAKDEIIDCYVSDENMYLPNDDISKVDLRFIANNANIIQSEVNQLTDKSLKEMYHYITNKTAYDHSALQYDSSIYTPYLMSSFFEGKKVVCDGYSKTFSFLANSKNQNQEVKRITGSRQNLDKKDEKSFLHSWVQIGNKYYDPTFDDNDDNREWSNYFNKSQTCFNLDHYTEGRKMFISPRERLEYIKNNSSHLINTCPQITAQILGKDKFIKEYIQYGLDTNQIEELKKIMCDGYQICVLQAQNKNDLIRELSQYTLQFGNQKITLHDLKKGDNMPSNTSIKLDQKTKKLLDQIVRDIKIKMLFYKGDKKEKFRKGIKMRITMILLDKNVPDEIKNAMKYINERI